MEAAAFVCFPAEKKENNFRPTAGGAVHISRRVYVAPDVRRAQYS
jgi:hypothetical protein